MSSVEGRQEEATKLYTKCFDRLNFGFNEVEMFRQGYEYGQPLANRRIMQAGIEFARAVYHNPEFDKFLKDRDGFFKAAGGIDGLAQLTADKQIAACAAAVESAMLLFAHAVLDQVSRDLLVVAAYARPERWEQRLEKRQVTLEEVRGRSYDDVLANKAQACAKGYDHKSLMDKVDELFSVCRPSNMDLIKDYKYDRERLADLDTRRHDIAHRATISALPNGKSDIDFLRKTGHFIFAIVNNGLDVKIDVRYSMTDRR